jgi:hypothetical protein
MRRKDYNKGVERYFETTDTEADGSRRSLKSKTCKVIGFTDENSQKAAQHRTPYRDVVVINSSAYFILIQFLVKKIT